MSTKLSVRRIINLKLFFVNIGNVIAINSASACFNKTGNKQGSKR
jgi:hypothetical protein